MGIAGVTSFLARYTYWITVVAIATSALCACDFGIVYVDPPVERGKGGLLIEGDPYVELGFYHEQLYDPLSEGGDCPIVYGLQGGTWTHPAIRIQGIAPKATIDCRITTDADDELVGQATAVSQFFVTPDAFFEVQAYPVAIVHSDPDKGPSIDDLFGQSAILNCTVTDDEQRAAEASIGVTLQEG